MGLMRTAAIGNMVVVGALLTLSQNAIAATFTAANVPAGLSLTWGQVAFFDYDHDGDDDLLIHGAYRAEDVANSIPRLYLLANQGNGTFLDVTADAQLPTDRQTAQNFAPLATGDYDNDGDLDVFLTVGEEGTSGPAGTQWSVYLQLLKNDGAGHFTVVHMSVGPSLPRPLQLGGLAKLVLADFNGDGWLDCYAAIGQYYIPTTDPYPPVRHGLLFQNNQDGTFTDVSVAAGLATGEFAYPTDAIPLDIELDGDTDLYVVTSPTLYSRALSWRGNLLLVNQGDGIFIEHAEARGALGPEGSFHTAVASGLFRTGELVIVAGQDVAGSGPNVQVYGLQSNGTQVNFLDGTSQFNFGVDGESYWDIAILDADNDADSDIVLLGDPTTRLYLQQADGTFMDTTVQSGLTPSAGRNLALADVDLDGHLDAYVTSNTAHANTLYRNTGAAPGGWVEIKVVTSDRRAFGLLRIEESTNNEPGTCCQEQRYFAHGGDSPYVHLGTGTHIKPVVKISWPDDGGVGVGFHVNYYPVKPNHRLIVTDDFDPAFEPIGDRTAVAGQLFQIPVRVPVPDGIRIALTARLAGGQPLSTIGAAFTDQGDGLGLFTWTPGFNQVGEQMITFEVDTGATHTSRITVTSAPLPEVPANLAAAPRSERQIRVTWSDRATNETSYQLERVSEPWASLMILPANAQEYLDSGLQPNTAVSYRVRACHGGGCSAFTNAVSARTDQVITLTAVADAWVEFGNQLANHGREPTLQIGGLYLAGKGSVAPNKALFVKFQVPTLNGSVQTASLQLLCQEGSRDGGTIASTSTAWSEDAITYATQPARLTGYGLMGAVTPNTWVSRPVNGSVSGPGQVSYTVHTGVEDEAAYYAREGYLGSRLVLTVRQMPLAVTNFSASPNPFSPNNDGVNETTTFRATTSAPVTSWSVMIRNSSGTVARVLNGSAPAGTTGVTQFWDGQIDYGGGVINRAWPGMYSCTLTVSGAGATASRAVSVTVQ